MEALDPIDGKLVMFFNPRQQQWQEHFCWSNDYTRIIGVTLTGRATVDALHLKCPGLVNIRQVLYLIGKHPPNLNEA